MRAAVVTIGDEITTGHVLDTNARTLARWLTGRGHEVVRHASVGDDAAEIGAEIVRARSDCDVVLVSGGLGGTPDDRTLDALGALVGRAVVESPRVLAALEATHRARGRRLPATTRRIAREIDGSVLLDNPVGQAPGVFFEADGNPPIVLLPGVPAELEAIVAGPLAVHLPADPSAGEIRTFRTVGIGEAILADRLREKGALEAFAFLPWPGGVDLRLRVSPGTPGAESERLTRTIEEVAGDACLGEGPTTLESVVADRLRAEGKTLAIAESLTGGDLLSRLVAGPGASGFLAGGVVAYSNEMKIDLLGVARRTLDTHGAVSAEVAREMALGVRERANAAWGISTTGIAGPEGGTDRKPVGLVFVAVAGPGGEARAIERRFFGPRVHVIALSGSLALDVLRRALFGLPLDEESIR